MRVNYNKTASQQDASSLAASAAHDQQLQAAARTGRARPASQPTGGPALSFNRCAHEHLMHSAVQCEDGARVNVLTTEVMQAVVTGRASCLPVAANDFHDDCCDLELEGVQQPRLLYRFSDLPSRKTSSLALSDGFIVMFSTRYDGRCDTAIKALTGVTKN